MIELLKIKHGSQLYGTNTPESDIDWKVIYLPELEDLVVGNKIEIIKVKPGKAQDKMEAGAEECEYIPIQIFAQHFLESQSYAMEIAFATLQGLATSINPKYNVRLTTFMRELVGNFLNKNVDSIVGYSYSQSLKYGLKGERLQAIRELRAKIVDEQTLRPAAKNWTIADVACQWFDRDDKKPIFITDIPETRSNLAMEALSIGNKLYAFNTTLKHFTKALDILEAKYGARTEKSLDGHDWKAISHALRITGQGVEVLSTGKLEFPTGQRAYLLRVKQGLEPEEAVYARLDELFHNLKDAQLETNLPERTPKMNALFQSWLRHTMMEFYLPKMELWS